jgi:hypothetical protein
MSTLSLREQVSQNIVDSLMTISEPNVVLITREPFDVEKLAITQFPALLVQVTEEQRETITMGVTGSGRRAGTIIFQIRGFVRGVELDTRRNQLIAAVEDILDSDRYRDTAGVVDSQVTLIEIVPRLQPLAEFTITFSVRYNYARGTL